MARAGCWSADLESRNLPVNVQQTAIVRDCGKGVGAVARHGNATAKHQADVGGRLARLISKLAAIPFLVNAPGSKRAPAPIPLRSIDNSIRSTSARNRCPEPFQYGTTPASGTL